MSKIIDFSNITVNEFLELFTEKYVDNFYIDTENILYKIRKHLRGENEDGSVDVLKGTGRIIAFYTLFAFLRAIYEKKFMNFKPDKAIFESSNGTKYRFDIFLGKDDVANKQDGNLWLSFEAISDLAQKCNENCNEDNLSAVLGFILDNIDNYTFNPPDKKDSFIGYVEKLEEILNENKNEGVITLSEKEDIDVKIKGLITDGGCRQIVFTGAPGTGKTYTARQIATELGAEENLDAKNFVQFHPSFDYTDFVEGIRPLEDKDGNMVFKKVDGIFKAFCRKVAEQNKVAKQNNKEPLPLYFFIIDEINRANLSKVFGELMFCFEKDKRGENNRVVTQYSNLKTYDTNGNEIKDDIFEDGFYIPENVVIIGTMNDIDRSVDSMDFALRRRFEWVEFEVNEDSLTKAFESMFKNKETAEALATSTVALNNYIKDNGKDYGFNKDYFISQGQFANIPENQKNSVKEIKEYVWEYRIKSLLKEYLRGESAKNIETFCDGAIGALKNEEG